MNMKAIFFDLDDTLHDHQKPFADSLAKSFPHFPSHHEIEDVYKKLRYHSDLLWEHYTENKITLGELRVKRIIAALRDFDFEITEGQAQEFQHSYELALQQITLFPEIPNLLDSLDKHGFKLGMITNGPVEHQKNKIAALGLDKYFPKDHIFISDEVGIAKPDPTIFKIAAERLGLQAEEILYVGDTWINDIVGSSEAGWQSLWFNHRNRKPETDHQPTYETDSLDSILSFIQNKEISY